MWFILTMDNSAVCYAYNSNRWGVATQCRNEKNLPVRWQIWDIQYSRTPLDKSDYIKFP